MNSKKLFFNAGNAGFILGIALLGMLTGCYADRPGPERVYVAPPAVVVVQDDYIYYPDYQVYYNNSRRQYAYREGNTWVSRPAPQGVQVNVLRASPSVKMNFHDAPANHHAAVVQQYPPNWRPPGANQGQKENHQNGQPDGNNAR